LVIGYFYKKTEVPHGKRAKTLGVDPMGAFGKKRGDPGDVGYSDLLGYWMGL